MKTKKHNISRKELIRKSPGFREWFRIEGTDIVSNGEIALRLCAKRLAIKWTERPKRLADSLDMSGLDSRIAERSNDSTSSATYFQDENGKRALIDDGYLEMVGSPSTLMFTDREALSIYGSESWKNISSLMVDNTAAPSFWISPISERDRKIDSSGVFAGCPRIPYPKGEKK